MTSLPINDLLRRFPRLSDIEDDVRHSFSIPERTYYPVPSSQIWTERNVRMPELDMLPFHIRDELKKQLGVVNEAKNKFDSIPELKDAEHVVRVFDFYGGLKNYLQNVKSAQIVTNAWLKCYEMLQDYNLTAVAGDGQRPLRVFYNAELPGAFISATNHYCSNNNIPFDWVASSYFPKEGHTMLGDKYGMYANYRNRWIMDADMNGDLTQPDTLLSIKQRVLYKFPQGADMYFSDAGMDVEGRFNEQEEINSLLNYGQILSGLMTLGINGNFIIKQYTFYKPLTLSLIALLRNMFADFAIVKPKTSRPTNSEVYLVGRGFYGLLPSVEVRLLDIMRNLRDICEKEGIYNPIDMGVRCAEFGFYRADEHFYREMIDISGDIFVKIQSMGIETMIRCISDYKLHRFAPNELAKSPFVFYVQRIWHTRAMDEYLYTKRVRRIHSEDSFKLSRGMAKVAVAPPTPRASEVIVRLCNPRDIPSVQTVMMEIFNSDFKYGFNKKYHWDYDAREFEKAYLDTRGNFMYVATVGGNVVGMGGVRMEGYRSRNLDKAFTDKYYHTAKQPVAKIVRVFVTRQYRNKGVARMIVEKVLDRLRTDLYYKKSRIVLDSEYAPEFWRKMGAVEILKEKHKDYTTTYFEFSSQGVSKPVGMASIPESSEVSESASEVSKNPEQVPVSSEVSESSEVSKKPEQVPVSSEVSESASEVSKKPEQVPVSSDVSESSEVSEKPEQVPVSSDVSESIDIVSESVSEKPSETVESESKELSATYPTYSREELTQRVQRDGLDSTADSIRNEFRDNSTPFPYGHYFIDESSIHEKAQRIRTFTGVWKHEPYSIRPDENDPKKPLTRRFHKGDYMLYEPTTDDYIAMDNITTAFTDESRMHCYRNIPNRKTASMYDGWNKYGAYVKGAISQVLRDDRDLNAFELREAIYRSSIKGDDDVEYTECAHERPTFLAMVFRELFKLVGADASNIKMLDACAGWGDRLVVAMILNIQRYVGVEPNVLSTAGFQKAIRLLGGTEGTTKYTMYGDGFPNVIASLPANETYHIVFLSPPAYDSEFYSDDEKQSTVMYRTKDEWLSGFLYRTVDYCWSVLEKGGVLVIQSLLSRTINTYIQDKYRANAKYEGILAIRTGKSRNKPLWVWMKA